MPCKELQQKQFLVVSDSNMRGILLCYPRHLYAYREFCSRLVSKGSKMIYLRRERYLDSNAVLRALVYNLSLRQ